MNPEEQQTPVQPSVETEDMKMPENSSMSAPTEEPTKMISGPLLLILALILIVLLGGMYYWFTSMTMEPTMTDTTNTRPTAEQNNEPESTTAEAQTGAMQTTSPSDEISAIEADLESTDLDSLDADLGTIEAEMDAEATAQ